MRNPRMNRKPAIGIGIAAIAKRQLQFELEGDYVELNQLLKLDVSRSIG